MEDNKTNQPNPEQTGNKTNQQTTQNANQKETSTNNPVEQNNEKTFPGVGGENEEEQITNGPNTITDVPNEDREDSDKITNVANHQEQPTNQRRADDIGLNKRKDGSNL